jgi:hypothetical protein
LARRVVCTWVDPSREDGHAVLPDACIDLVWDGGTLVVAGPDTQAWWVTSQSAFVGIRFQPGSAPGFLGVPASELLNQALPLSEFWGHSQADRLAERLAECGSDIAVCKVLEECVFERQASAWTLDDMVEQVVHDLRHSRERGSCGSVARCGWCVQATRSPISPCALGMPIRRT